MARKGKGKEVVTSIMDEKATMKIRSPTCVVLRL